MSNIKLKKLTMSNFMSFGKGPTEIILDEGYSWLVVGQNNDAGDEGESGNGSGKTSMMQGVVFALFGTGIDKMKSDEFINITNGKKLIVELEFEINGSSYRILRGRKPNIVELWDGETSLTRDSMKNTDADIQKLLGMSFEVFVRTVFMNPHIDSFMAMTPAEQRNFMESLLKLDVLADRADTLKNIIRKQLQDNIKLLERDVQHAESTNSKVHEQIRRLEGRKNEFEIGREEIIEQSSKEIEYLRITDEVKDALGKAVEISEKIDSLLIDRDDESRELEGIANSIQFLIQKRDTLVSTYKKRDEFRERTSKENERAVNTLKTLPSTGTLTEYLEAIDEIVKTNEVIKYSTVQATSLKKEIHANIRELNSIMDQVDTLTEGKCPFCKQEHFDDTKVDLLADMAEALDRLITDKEDELKELETLISQNNLAKNRKIVDEIEKENPEVKNFLSVGELTKKREELKVISETYHIDNPYEITICDMEMDSGSIEDIDCSINKLGDRSDKIKGSISEKSKEIIRLSDEHLRITSGLPVTSMKEIEVAEAEIIRLQKLLEDEKGKKNPYDEMIDEQTDMLIDMGSLDKTLSEEKSSLVHVNYLIKLLTDPKSFIRKNIVDQYIPFVNKKIVEHSIKLGLTHVASINADMSVDIEYMGKKISYFTMSRGERLRLNVSTSLAFRELMSMLGQSCNLLLIDELLDGSADASGMYAIFNMIKDFADDVFIISHRDEFKDQVDKNMTVIKKNGFSDIEIS